MLLGTLFTLFVVPVFYVLIARDHQKRPATSEDPLGAPSHANADTDLQPELA